MIDYVRNVLNSCVENISAEQKLFIGTSFVVILFSFGWIYTAILQKEDTRIRTIKNKVLESQQALDSLLEGLNLIKQAYNKNTIIDNEIANYFKSTDFSSPDEVKKRIGEILAEIRNCQEDSEDEEDNEPKAFNEKMIKHMVLLDSDEENFKEVEDDVFEECLQNNEPTENLNHLSKDCTEMKDAILGASVPHQPRLRMSIPKAAPTKGVFKKSKSENPVLFTI